MALVMVTYLETAKRYKRMTPSQDLIVIEFSSLHSLLCLCVLKESFEWFRHIMTQAAEEDEEGIVDMHNYLTSAYGDDDPRSFLLKAAQDRFHARTGHDIITNARTKVLPHTLT
jgi:hypothetical protein